MKTPKSFIPKKNLEEELKKIRPKKSIIETLEELDPERNVVFTAIDHLKKEEEIKQFYKEYICYLKEKGDTKEVREEAEDVANKNIGYVLGYYDQQTSHRWNSILEEVKHPIFGKDIPFKESDNKLDEKAQDYINNRWKEKYPLDEYGTWEIRGEDPNCDFGGYHHEPLLGTYKGRFIDVLTYAVNLNGFYTWGSGGRVKKVSPSKIKKIGPGGKKK